MKSQSPPLKFSILAFISLFLINLNACGKPTYPGDKVTEAVAKICREEYHLEVEPRIYGKTLWLYFPMDDLFDKEGKLNKDIDEKIWHATFSIQRVLLSTDKKIDFYVLVFTDVKYTGFDFINVGYLADVRRVRLLDISRADYSKRIVDNYQDFLEKFSANPEAIGDYQGNHIDYVDISLPKFLAEQIIQRIRKEFAEDKTLSKYFKIYSQDWTIKNRVFVFDIILERLSEKVPAKINPQKVMLKSATYILKNYNYQDFKGLKLYNPLGSGFTYLTKKEVFSFR